MRSATTNTGSTSIAGAYYDDPLRLRASARSTSRRRWIDFGDGVPSGGSDRGLFLTFLWLSAHVRSGLDFLSFLGAGDATSVRVFTAVTVTAVTYGKYSCLSHRIGCGDSERHERSCFSTWHCSNASAARSDSIVGGCYTSRCGRASALEQSVVFLELLHE